MIVSEGTTHDRADWVDVLHCSAEQLDELIDRGLFELTRGGNWKLKFVGSLVFQRSVWFCIPSIAETQYTSAPIEPKFLKLLFRVLENYSRRSVDRTAGRDTLGTHLSASEYAMSPMRELELLLALVEWTTTYGFHATDVEYRTTSTNRPIRWSDTINRTLPSHLRTGTAYFEPSSASVLKSPSTLGTIQAHAISSLLSKYRIVAQSLLDASLDLVEEANSIRARSNTPISLSSPDLYESLNETNLDHEKELITLLLSLAAIERAKYDRNQTITLYGTTAFELVWEDMCRLVFGGSNRPGDFLSNPRYRLSARPEEIPVAKQRPDVLCEYRGRALVLDAKYYARFPLTHPSLEDIRKQIFYTMSLPKGTISLCAFLLPSSQTNNPQYLGCAAMIDANSRDKASNDHDERFPVVHCIALPWKRMIDCYLNVRSSSALREEVFDGLLASKELV